MKLPLSGIKVLSLARLLPGAYCTRLLADLGAEIIMVEHPIGGDPMRTKPAFFAAMCRRKKSLTLDMKAEKGKEILRQLARKSDVVIESFRPGVAARLGVDYESLRPLNPKLVYASISGFGQDGPFRLVPGHDLMFQGISGALADKVSTDSGFTQPLVPTADLSSGMFAAFSILAALYQNKDTGEGRYLDISMADGLVEWMSIWLSSNEEFGVVQPLAGYGVFKTKDSKYIALGIDEEQHFWMSLCRVIGREDLGNLTPQERRDRRAELDPIIKKVFLTRTCAEWMPVLLKADIPASQAYTSAADVSHDPQLLARKMVIPEASGQRIGSSLPFAKDPAITAGPLAELGEHTEEILLSIGYSQDAIKQLKIEKVV
jgi:crotonobetainyl-CoA:carnitine CoA-transferase CaiB-like acyl-CoA transferase